MKVHFLYNDELEVEADVSADSEGDASVPGGLRYFDSVEIEFVGVAGVDIYDYLSDKVIARIEEYAIEFAENEADRYE